MLSVQELRRGSLEVVGQLAGASNYSLLSKLTDDSTEGLVVYKPRRGETPLWDFTLGTLCQREVAAFVVSEAAGFGFVPPTVLRDGPLGEGAVQSFVDHDPAVTAFDLDADHLEALRRVALFDLVVNNADRKGGHVVLDTHGSIWCLDHGICFHHEPKLRTVLWDFVGEAITDSEIEALKGLQVALTSETKERLAKLLSAEEVEALSVRLNRLLSDGRFPAPGPGRHVPWPPV